MKKLQFCIAITTAFGLSSIAHAEEKADCATLKQSIEEKMTAHGVKKFKLDVVDKDQAGAGKVVGTCDGGTHKIVYTKDTAPETAQK